MIRSDKLVKRRRQPLYSQWRLQSEIPAGKNCFFALLESGDHVVFFSVTYIAVYRLLNELLNRKFYVETSIVQLSNSRYERPYDG